MKSNLTYPFIDATIDTCVYTFLYLYFAPYFVIGQQAMPIPNLCLLPQTPGWSPTAMAELFKVKIPNNYTV